MTFESQGAAAAAGRVFLAPIPKKEAPTLRNLFELYAHDFSEHVALDIGESGRFDVPLADAWWGRDDHFPFFIRRGDNLSGFALARRGSKVTGESDVMDVAEFFVVRGARKRGVGRAAAHALFAAFPGRWEVRVRQTNVTALQFWSSAIETFAPPSIGGARDSSAPFSSGGVDWQVFSFGP
jgi:predicted acetyltransferase